MRISRKVANRLPMIWLAWVWVYLIWGSLVSDNEVGFLAAPVDASLPPWFKLLFLNVPLQMAMALTSTIMLRGDGPPSMAASLLSYATCAMIAMNILAAIWFVMV